MADAPAPAAAGAVVEERPPFHLSVGQVSFGGRFGETRRRRKGKS
jgi:hypothetical protein